jgi:hypothetical protein
LAGRDKDGKGKGNLCQTHSYPDHLAKHTWAKCAENPANQKKWAVKRAEAYYAHNERRPASDNESHSNHCMALVSNSKESSRRLVYSKDKDNFAIAISALPCK